MIKAVPIIAPATKFSFFELMIDFRQTKAQ
jgi:hypothetical protein